MLNMSSLPWHSLPYDDQTFTMSVDDEEFYGTIVNMCQFLLSVTIVVVNGLAFASIVGTASLRNSTHHLLVANLWFANVILGLTPITIIVGNAIQHQTDSSRISLVRSSLTGAMMNSTASLATMVAILTAVLMSKNASTKMDMSSVVKVMAGIWACIVALLTLKTIVLAVYHEYRHVACYPCVLGFESALIAIFVLLVIALYVLAICQRHSTECHNLVTVGMCVSLQFVCISSVALLVVRTILYDRIEESVQSEVLLLAYNMHALLNPLVYVLRTRQALCALRRIICGMDTPPRSTCELVRDAPPAYRTYDDLQRVPYDQIQSQAHRIVVTSDLTVNRDSILMV